MVGCCSRNEGLMFTSSQVHGFFLTPKVDFPYSPSIAYCPLPLAYCLLSIAHSLHTNHHSPLTTHLQYSSLNANTGFLYIHCPPVKSGNSTVSFPSSIDFSLNGVIALQAAASYTSIAVGVLRFTDSIKE